ncbi:MAG: hypothetical protein HC923_10300 [Myxococcales bacterium]|nr:hypothetical protein [Myxococcales bacterium]
MPMLRDHLLVEDKRRRVIQDAERLVDAEVQGKSGISGFAIKAGYKAVRAIKPALIPEAIDHLMDRFVERLEPYFATWDSSGRATSFERYLSERKADVANALLGVTDERARHSHGTVKATYERLRPQGQKNVEAAVPGIGRIIDDNIR